MICDREVRELITTFGDPIRRTYHIEADEYIRAYRWRPDLDRRAEVVFAIQDPNEQVWMHTKAHYPAHLSRLPSGGVECQERIYDALLREIAEETGWIVTNYEVTVQRFIGLLEYHFHHNGSVRKFASYIFHLQSNGTSPTINDPEEIYTFRAIRPSQLLQLTVDMRNMVGERRGWGQWRSLAHELVHDYLCGPCNAAEHIACAND
ncbi:MAG: NUDIX hydrolase [Caldilineaceae bacterium]|nr:NUDIX hydrolase [Caldilineaceae bacterium]